jgi:hypothetical protein
MACIGILVREEIVFRELGGADLEQEICLL